jgi:hypothetical protein
MLMSFTLRILSIRWVLLYLSCKGEVQLLYVTRHLPQLLRRLAVMPLDLGVIVVSYLTSSRLRNTTIFGSMPLALATLLVSGKLFIY